MGQEAACLHWTWLSGLRTFSPTLRPKPSPTGDTQAGGGITQAPGWVHTPH